MEDFGMNRHGWHRMWRNHKRGRPFWKHPKRYWFPQGVTIGVLVILLCLWSMVYDDEISNVGALIGFALGLGMLVMVIIRLCKNKPEWRGKHRPFSLLSTVLLSAFVAMLAWTLLSK